MFMVMVSMLHQGGQFQFWYKKMDDAQKAYRKLVAKGRGENDFEFEASDDFGQTIMINRDGVAAIVLQDVRHAQEAQVEISVMAGRTQAKIQAELQAGQLSRPMMVGPNGSLPFMGRG